MPEDDANGRHVQLSSNCNVLQNYGNRKSQYCKMCITDGISIFQFLLAIGTNADSVGTVQV